MNTVHAPALLRVLTGLLFAAALVLPGAADAKRKKDYSDKTYGGKNIEEYCAELLGVESFDLTDEDLEGCDKQYSEQVDALDDFSVGDIDLERAPGEPNPELDEEPAEEQPKLSKKEQEDLEAKKAEEEKERLAGLGLVEFDEAPAEDGGDTDEEEDPLADDEFDEPGLGDEDVEVLDGEDDVDGDFGGGGSGSSLEDLDDFGDEDEGPSKKKDKKKNKKKDKKKDKKKKGEDDRFDDATDIPFD